MKTLSVAVAVLLLLWGVVAGKMIVEPGLHCARIHEHASPIYRAIAGRLCAALYRSATDTAMDAATTDLPLQKMSPRALMRLPVSALRSIPAASWTRLTAKQAAVLPPALLSQLSRAQLASFPPVATAALSAESQRVYRRMRARPSRTTRVVSTVLAAGLAYLLFAYS